MKILNSIESISAFKFDKGKTMGTIVAVLEIEMKTYNLNLPGNRGVYILLVFIVYIYMCVCGVVWCVFVCFFVFVFVFDNGPSH